MPNPNLIHPISVIVERLNTAEMVMDPDTREPMHGARSSAADRITVQAQINWGARKRPSFDGGGVEENSDGYILCRTYDLQKLGGLLKRGDRIVQIGTGANAIEVDLYLTRQEPMGHWPDQNGATLVRYHFEDRAPVKGV